MEELTGTTVAVTGADGFIGRAVVAELTACGADVRRIVGPSAAAGGGGSVRAVDLRDADAAADALADVELVVHLAARAGGVAFQQAGAADVHWDNTAMTRNVLAAAATARRVFLASSAVVYAADAGDPIGEDAPLVRPGPDPVAPYAWSKLTDEAAGRWAAAAHGVDVVVGRFTNVYGPGAPADGPTSTVVHALIAKILAAAPDGEAEVWGDGTAVRSFVHVRDAASAVRTLLTAAGDGEVCNISATGPVSIRQLAETIRDRLAPDVQLRFDASKPTGVPRRVLATRRLEALGWRPQVDLADGVVEVGSHR